MIKYCFTAFAYLPKWLAFRIVLLMALKFLINYLKDYQYCCSILCPNLLWLMSRFSRIFIYICLITFYHIWKIMIIKDLFGLFKRMFLWIKISYKNIFHTKTNKNRFGRSSYQSSSKKFYSFIRCIFDCPFFFQKYYSCGQNNYFDL